MRGQPTARVRSVIRANAIVLCVARLVHLHVGDWRLGRIDRERRRCRRASPSVHKLLSLGRHCEASSRRVERVRCRSAGHVTDPPASAEASVVRSCTPRRATRPRPRRRDVGAGQRPDSTARCLRRRPTSASACSSALLTSLSQASSLRALARAPIVDRSQCVRCLGPWC